jgi:hypothetical protein
VGSEIYDFSFSESGGRHEITDCHFLLLCSLYDFCGFFLRIIRKNGFPHGVMYAPASIALALAHSEDLSKNVREKKDTKGRY